MAAKRIRASVFSLLACQHRLACPKKLTNLPSPRSDGHYTVAMSFQEFGNPQSHISY